MHEVHCGQLRLHFPSCLFSYPASSAAIIKLSELPPLSDFLPPSPPSYIHMFPCISAALSWGGGEWCATVHMIPSCLGILRLYSLSPSLSYWSSPNVPLISSFSPATVELGEFLNVQNCWEELPRGMLRRRGQRFTVGRAELQSMWAGGSQVLCFAGGQRRVDEY